MEKLKLLWPGRSFMESKERPDNLETRKAAALFASLSPAQGECKRKASPIKFCPDSIPALIWGGKFLHASSTSPTRHNTELDRSLWIDAMASECKKENCNGFERVC